MENLKWEVDQKEREIQSLKQQLDLTEQQNKKELDGIQQLLQVCVGQGPGAEAEAALPRLADGHNTGPRQHAECET